MEHAGHGCLFVFLSQSEYEFIKLALDTEWGYQYWGQPETLPLRKDDIPFMQNEGPICVCVTVRLRVYFNNEITECATGF